MQSKLIRLAGAIACLAIAIPVFAQYGHPLKGTWSGDWAVTKGKENRILLDFNWDGKNLTGVLNPGPDASPMKNLTLTPPDVITAGKAAIAARDAALANPAPAVAAPAAPTAPLAGVPGPAAATAGTAAKTATAATATKAAPAAAGAATKAAAATAGTAAKAATAAPTPAASRGAAAAPAAKATKDNLDVATDPWLLHFEAEAKDAVGKMVKVVVDGKMENLGAAYTRVITGKWVQGTQTGTFKVIRN